ncbi:TPA: hypothetical protein MXC83_005372 [Klebsiella quasipneumoniae]|nr:hypothetical protein [Klebsiella quasipneumoniae]
MTPLQRRRQNTAMSEVAIATHKRYLGRPELLTGIQSAWIKSLLSVWGEAMRGGTAPRLPRGHACWQTIRGKNWSDKALERFTEAIKQAREEGYQGQHVLNRAHAILWPKPATSIIDTAMRNDDADFVEQCVLKAFDISDPVYIVGMSFYTTRKKVADLARDLQHVAPWLTFKMAKDRVNWCLQIFQAQTFLSARQSLKAESE